MSANKHEDMFVSVVLLVLDTGEDLETHIRQTTELLESSYTNYELIIIGDALPEHGALQQLLDEVPCVRIIMLSRKENKDVYVFAGLEAAIGDIVVVMKYGQDPIDLIPKFVVKNRTADIVFGLSSKKTRKGFLNQQGAKMFYAYNKRQLNISIPENSTYFMSLSRKAVNAVTRSGRHARHIRYLARQIGYNSVEIVYEPLGSLSQKRHVGELSLAAIELATSYSRKPLRSLTWLGFAVALLNLLYAGYVVFVNLVKKNVVEGWTSSSLQMSIMFFFLFAILAILSEYIGKILEEVRGEPPYHVLDELNSKVSIADVTRRNITK